MRHIVMDLEMNLICKKSSAKKVCNMEIIEIGATMLDDHYQEISSFKTYVQPEYNGRIEPVISRLTGITEEMVQDAPRFHEALKKFWNWCLEGEEEVAIYAWSETDFRQVHDEIMLKGYEMTEREEEVFRNGWNDLQKIFDKQLGFDRQVSLKMALDIAGLEFQGQEHDALDDARNTAELFRIFQNQERFDKTLRKIEMIMRPQALNTALGSMIDFSAFMLA